MAPPVVLFLCLCVAAVQTAPAGNHVSALHAAAPAPTATVITSVKSQYHTQDGLGQYSYGYASPGQHKEELRGADGTVVGNYGYLGPDGRHRQINYVADDAGFHAAGDDVPAAPVAEVAASPVASVHVSAIVPTEIDNAAPVAAAELALHAAPAAAPVVHTAPALSVGVAGAEAHAAEVHQTHIITISQSVAHAPAPVVAAEPAVYAAAPSVFDAVPTAEARAAELHQTNIATVAEPVAAAQPSVYTAPALSVVVPGAEAHASETRQTRITTIVQPAVYAEPAVAVAAPAPVVHSAPIPLAAPSVSYVVSGAQAHASESHHTQVTSVIQPAVYTVPAPAIAAAAFKHAYKLH